jgi:hypothetical protein
LIIVPSKEKTNDVSLQTTSPHFPARFSKTEQRRIGYFGIIRLRSQTDTGGSPNAQRHPAPERDAATPNSYIHA